MPLLAIPFPSFDPVLISIGPFAIRWYALAYIVGILGGWLYARALVRSPKLWGGPAPLTVTECGGFVLWVELPKHINAVQLQDAAYEQGIGLAPGEIFSAKAGYKNYIRISFCTMWSAGTEKALAKLGKLCRML